MPAAALLSSLIESSLNAWLKQSKQQQEVPPSLVDKQFSIELSDLKLKLSFAINQAGEISVLNNDEATNCKVIADLSTLKKLDDSSQIPRLLKSGELDLIGDIHIAQHFADWFKQSLSHWQDVLASLVGDIACYKISHTGEQIKQSINVHLKTQTKVLRNMIFDDKRLSPHPIEFEDFSKKVNSLRQDSERLEARMTRLDKQL
jgi:ubiquinone biosynthesis accessory factor UbiJ